MIETSQSIAKLTTALLQVQGGISGVKKNAKNPHFRNSYATLENVIDTARPALQEAGITFTQAPGMLIDGALEVTTMLIHGQSGEWMRSTLHVPLAKRDPQGVGSAITYACRYSLMAMLGLPPTDDDGEAATDRSGGGFEQPSPDRPLNLPKPSAAALKRSDVWAEMEREIAECKSVPMLLKLRTEWSRKALKDKWPVAWCDAAADTFEKAEMDLRAVETDSDFPGDKPAPKGNGKIISTLQAG